MGEFCSQDEDGDMEPTPRMATAKSAFINTRGTAGTLGSEGKGARRPHGPRPVASPEPKGGPKSMVRARWVNCSGRGGSPRPIAGVARRREEGRWRVRGEGRWWWLGIVPSSDVCTVPCTICPYGQDSVSGPSNGRLGKDACPAVAAWAALHVDF